MKIIPKETGDPAVLSLFSQHDSCMLEALGEDRVYYTRYGEEEKLQRVWLAWEEDCPVGCAAYRKKDGETGEVKRMYVKREHRGKGISKALLQAVEDWAREDGCRKLYLDTRLNLEPAVSLYRAAGFQIVFQQGMYIQMEKQL